MRLIVRTTLNFVNGNNQQSFKKYLRLIYENEENKIFYEKFEC